MKEIDITKYNLKRFLSNLRSEDKDELLFFLGKNYRQKFINFLLENKNDTYFLSFNNNPACIGGFYQDTIGLQVWLLCSNSYDKKYLYKYIKEKFAIYKNKYNFIYNYIYKANFKSLKLVRKLGFEVKELNNVNIKLFYYLKGDNLDI